MKDMDNMDNMKHNATNCTDSPMQMDMSMDMMKMYFHTGYESHILIENWSANTDAGMPLNSAHLL